MLKGHLGQSCSKLAHAHPSGSSADSPCPVPWLFVFSLSVPFLAAFGEDAFEKLGAGFVGAAFLAGEFGFGGDELAFAGGFEDGGAVAFEVGLHAPQARDSRLQPRELLLDLRDDLALFVERRQRNLRDLLRSDIQATPVRSSMLTCR